MWDNAKFKRFCADVCARYDARGSDVYTMVQTEAETIEREYKQAGRRLTYRATVEAIHAAIERCTDWLKAPRFIPTAAHIASLRRAPIYFGMLTKRGEARR